MSTPPPIARQIGRASDGDSGRMALSFLELANWEIGLSGRERHQPRKCERLWTPPNRRQVITPFYSSGNRKFTDTLVFDDVARALDRLTIHLYCCASCIAWFYDVMRSF